MAVLRPGSRGPHHFGCSIKAMAAAAVVLALVFVGPNAAEAHEITVAIVVSVGADGAAADARAAVDGLRLAIDQSPDVGHEPGPDAGDHLGGVDVKLIDLGSVSEVVVGPSVLAAVTDGATLVVVIGGAHAQAAVAELLPPGSAFAIAVMPDSLDTDVSLQGAVLRVSPTGNADAVGSLSEAFETAYDQELSESAGIGYDIGRLLDLLIAETNGALPDLAAIDSVSATPQSQLTFIKIVGADELPQASTEKPADTSSDNDRSGILPAVLVSLVVAVGILMIGVHRHRSGSNGSPQNDQ